SHSGGGDVTVEFGYLLLHLFIFAQLVCNGLDRLIMLFRFLFPDGKIMIRVFMALKIIFINAVLHKGSIVCIMIKIIKPVSQLTVQFVKFGIKLLLFFFGG